MQTRLPPRFFLPDLALLLAAVSHAPLFAAAALAKEPVEVGKRDRSLANVIAWSDIGDRDASGELCRRHRTNAFHRMDAAAGGHVAVSIKEVKFDPEWAPMASVCVGTEAPGNFACFKLGLEELGGDALRASLSALPADQKTELDHSDLPQGFRVGQVIDLAVDVDHAYLRISIGGQLAGIHHMEFRPELIRLGCSTALCGFRFQQ